MASASSKSNCVGEQWFTTDRFHGLTDPFHDNKAEHAEFSRIDSPGTLSIIHSVECVSAQ